MTRKSSPQHVLCVIPAERAPLSTKIASAGAIPVVDLTCAGAESVPKGAWVRVRSRKSVPGTGPVILVDGPRRAPIRNRETWLEVTTPVAAPEGFEGIVLRGHEAGGPCGAAPGLEMLAKVPEGTKVILDAGITPASAASAGALGVDGVVVSDLLWAFPELDFPASFREKIDRAEVSGTHIVNGFRIMCSPLAPVLRRLLDGASFWDQAEGWLTAANSSETAWPVGTAAFEAGATAARYHNLLGLIQAFDAGFLASVSPLRQRPKPTTSSVGIGENIDDAVAIIGLGCRLPGAQSVQDFWDNILAGRSAITEVPKTRWDPALFWDPDHAVPDKTYAKIGGFLTGFKFNPRRFRIPPNVAKHIDQVQQAALEAVADALIDAGYRPSPRDEGIEFDRNRVGVILGNSMGGEVTDDYTVRVRVPVMRQALESVPDFAALPSDVQQTILDAFEKEMKDSLPTITEDSMPGELSNVIAGRIANAFNLTGPNFTVDAACASSMAAIQTATKGLLDGDFDMVVTGGADRSMGAATFTKFSKIGALSAEKSAPFDASANGFVMGEGCGILLMKRLKDAQRDGNRIYAVVRAVGASSDGRGKGITAPNPVGQKLALRRAYADAGFDPVEVDLIECHGTSTVVGDKVEVECLTDVIGKGRRGARGPIRIGSVKSNIGHLKSAAGAASCIKAALSIYHKVFPPSINFENARSGVPFGDVPLSVQTSVEPWETTGVRRAGVSAFGFGGTNFHVVLEEEGAPQRGTSVASDQAVAVPNMPSAAHPVPAGVWAVSAESRAEMQQILRSCADPGALNRPFDASAPVRLAAAGATPEARKDQVGRALKTLDKGRSGDLLRGRGIHLEDEPVDGKVAFLFTGQGSQYIDMGLDLADEFEIVRKTFEEADEVMTPELGRPLTDFIRRNPDMEPDAQFEALRATEISQPATLTVDIAILRLLIAYGVHPDMVAGHSLGEYAAAVAAGIISFKEALVAVSARGREMASVQIEDKGRMAGIATNVETVLEVLAEIPGYVVPANKNCPTQTVIAGASDPVEAAIEAFRSRGITVYPLPVSHAFHSRIVAPASEPLERVLQRLSIQEPKRPITTNVTSRYYPTGDGARDKIIANLATQVASPVEWIAQIERMYADGARVFVECGPKRALTGFVVSILKRRPHRAYYTNHPKNGGLSSFRDTLAAMVTLGMPVSIDPGAAVPDLFGDAPARLATSKAMQTRFADVDVPSDGLGEASSFVISHLLEIIAQTTGYETDELSLEDELEADLGIDTVKQAEVVALMRDHFRLEHDPNFRLGDYRTLRDLANYAARRLGSTRPKALATPRPLVLRAESRSRDVAPMGRGEAFPGVSPELLASLVEGAVRAGLDDSDAESVGLAMLPALKQLMHSIIGSVKATQPAPVVMAPPAAPVAMPTMGAHVLPAHSEGVGRFADVDVVASGASVGLPGGTEVFGPDNFERILKGENRISVLPETEQDAILNKNVVRLQKDAKTGQGTFLPVEKREEVIRLAGVKAHFDLAADYGVDAGLIRALDVTSQLAIAAGIEALRDAGIPLVRTYRETTTGKRVATGWALPEALRDRTGVVFGSAFPGYDRLIQHLASGGDDGEGRFDRRFLFQVLSMGHSQFAQFIGARGPNTQVNAACASTTQAVAIAQDWIRAGRCDRVVVLGADDATSDNMMAWIGAGFLASGAATTKDVVEEAALPFDSRRHGMIIGMGAVGLVLERADLVAERGISPVARLLASSTGNSAFHGTRLDSEHISSQVDSLVANAVARAGVTRSEMAAAAMFMSHETYTPAKGGSAAAEIESLRKAFGASASQVVVANTKGFTGHAMGAGIEDAVAIKALQYQTVPPIPNLKDPDPGLGNLTLSRGGHYPIRFAIRLAAGFGSQLAVSVWEKVARGDERVVDEQARLAWLQKVTNLASPELVVQNRTLRAIAAEKIAVVPTPEDVPVAPALAPAAAEAESVDVVDSATEAPSMSEQADVAQRGEASTGLDEVLNDLLAIIAEKTGYEPEELDPDYELEADLGIDTVKQAEVFGVVRDRYGIATDDDFRISDYPTIKRLAEWVCGSLAAGGAALPTDVPDAVVPDAVVAEPTASEPEASEPEATVAPVAEAPSSVDAEAEAESDIDDPVEDASGAANVVDASAVHDVLLGIIAEKTGYDAEELDPEYELEADLGIDTVKQAEIFGDVRDHFGLSPDDDFRLSDYPTIAGLESWLVGALAQSPGGDLPAAATAPAEPAPAETVESEAADAEEEEEAPKPQPSAQKTSKPNISSVAVARAAEAPSVPLPASFRIRRPVLVERPLPSTGDLAGMTVETLGSGAFAKVLRRVLMERGATLCNRFEGNQSGPPNVVLDAGDDVLISFDVAKSLDASPPARWICVTRLGADVAWIDLRDGMACGARAGFAKALGREWEPCQAKVVDVAASVDDECAAQIICDELSSGDGAVEVIWQGDKRHTLELAIDPLPQKGKGLSGNPVIVLTGGTRGITAQIALEFARRGSCSLALLARTAPGETPLDESAAKAEIRKEIEAEGERATPVMVQRRLARLQAAEEARVNVENMRKMGAQVEFFVVDLAKEEVVGAVLQQVTERFGRVDGVIHGAGIEESRLLASKEMEDFHRVFDGKARGGLSLALQIPTRTWFVSMGSVAGRFGNAGQVDYSAANEAMARVCLSRPRSLHVGWTAWADVGMAVRGGMDRLLTERGVEMLPAQSGAALLVDMVLNATNGEVVVAGRLGDFGANPAHPLLDTMELDGDVVTVGRTLSLESDPWMEDHSIEGTPVLPGVVGLEMMAAAAALVRPGVALSGAKNVEFKSPVKLHRDTPVQLFVRAVPKGNSEVECTLSSERTAKTGRTLKADHFTCVVVMGDTHAIEPLPSTFFAESTIGADDIYRRFFHGPVFQVLRQVGAVATDVLMADAGVDHSPIAGGLLTAPLVLEAAFQAAGFHRMAVSGVMALPASIDQVVVERLADDGEHLDVMVRQVGDAYDVDVDSDRGAVLRLRGFRMIDTGPLPEDDRVPEPEGGWPKAMVATRMKATNRGGGMKSLLDTWLTGDEIADINRRGNARRIADRLVGRLAAKKALHGLLGMDPLQLEIANLPSGQPVVQGIQMQGFAPCISISHRDGSAVAGAATTGSIGIDLERVEDRSPSFAETWFAPSELCLARNSESETTIWCIKEAVLKALGQGMRLHPRDVVVRSLRTRTARVCLIGEAEEVYRRLTGNLVAEDGFLVNHGAMGDNVMACVWLPAKRTSPIIVPLPSSPQAA